jgi:HSP20 family molecular chaperone IbpA
MQLGADSIDDCDVLRSGRTGLVCGHRLLAPSTLGTFLRSFTLPTNVDPDKIQAVYQHGVLQLTLPKRDEAKPKAIAIKVQEK